MAEPSLLTVDAVEVEARPKGRPPAKILHGASFSVHTGTMMGLVGESGSGKSMTARAIMQQLPRNVAFTGGRILLRAEEISAYSEAEMHKLRGARIGMVFQNPRTALHPMLAVERQMGEVIRRHRRDTPKQARRDLACEYLELVGIPDPARVVRSYPHELSGGMAQRVVVATTLIAEPELLIADEPTTGLDATIQRRLLDLVRSLQQRLSLSVLMITHDLGIVAHYCDRVAVMYRGAIVEDGTNREILLAPQAEYTRRLIESSVADVRKRQEVKTPW